VKRFFSRLIAKVRRLAGTFLQFAQRDQILELSDQTRRLGAASVESTTYVSGELRALNDRLSRIEEELAELRRLIEGQDQSDSPGSSRERVASGQQRPD
jgi:hypothetical protein